MIHNSDNGEKNLMTWDESKLAGMNAYDHKALKNDGRNLVEAHKVTRNSARNLAEAHKAPRNSV